MPPISKITDETLIVNDTEILLLAFPIGSVYLQLYSKPTPIQLFPDTTWTEISSDFESYSYMKIAVRTAESPAYYRSGHVGYHRHTVQQYRGGMEVRQLSHASRETPQVGALDDTDIPSHLLDPNSQSYSNRTVTSSSDPSSASSTPLLSSSACRLWRRTA